MRRKSVISGKNKNLLDYIPSRETPERARGRETTVLRQLNEFGRGIVESPLFSIMVLDNKGTIVFVNEKFMNLSGARYPVKRNIFKIPFFKKYGLSRLYRELLTKGTPFRKESCATVDQSGMQKYVSIVAVPLRSETDDSIVGALSMAIDVTETMVAQQKLRELNADLESKVMSRTAELKRALDVNTQFIHDASHELRTPLNIIKLNLDIRPDNAPEIFEAIDTEVDRINQILEDLNLTIMIEGGDLKSNFKKLDLAEVVAQTIKRLRLVAREKNIQIIFRRKKDIPFVKGDVAKLEKLFLNLIKNAIKYGRKNGWIRIWLTLDRLQNLVSVHIADNGIGIPADELPHVFERFYRSTLSRRGRTGGFGLGLHICKWIAEQHGGFIAVKSKVGKGSVFTFTMHFSP